MKIKNIILILIFILFIVILVFLSYKTRNNLSKNTKEGIPAECQSISDVCELYDCMVNQCWCDKSNPKGAILYEKEITLKTNKDAEEYVQTYLDEKAIGETVTNAVELNKIFFNVFAEDSSGDENVYTVSFDGAIFKTQCGV
jgi:hypothetical protein